MSGYHDTAGGSPIPSRRQRQAGGDAPLDPSKEIVVRREFCSTSEVKVGAGTWQI